MLDRDFIIDPATSAFDASRLVRWNFLFHITKRGFDIALSVALLPVLGFLLLIVLALNPRYNAGPVLYVQKRMGRGCRPFNALKLRTMVSGEMLRGPEDELETHRITRLGGLLRQSRLDELPQILNVLKGDMSLIGPRPDCFEHASHFVNVVPGYRQRHAIRPGISGLAQTDVGYVRGAEATRRKVQADLHYIQYAGFRMDLYIFWRTLVVIFRRQGS